VIINKERLLSKVVIERISSAVQQELMGALAE
jgi:hypothetical protein